MVIESEILYNFPRFFGILVMKLATGGVVNFALKKKGDMIIENLDFEPKIYAMMREFLNSSWWEKLSKETGSFPSGDGSRGPEFVECTSILHQPDGVELQMDHIVPVEEFNGVSIALTVTPTVVEEEGLTPDVEEEEGRPKRVTSVPLWHKDYVIG
ncbi:hypothetical protein Tco_0231624 [Tanacetum coccineum]